MTDLPSICATAIYVSLSGGMLLAVIPEASGTDSAGYPVTWAAALMMQHLAPLFRPTPVDWLRVTFTRERLGGRQWFKRSHAAAYLPQITTHTYLSDMVSYSMLLLPILLLAEQVSSAMVNLGARADYYDACTDIANAIGASSVFYPGTLIFPVCLWPLLMLKAGDSDYASDIYHHFGSSTEEAACSVDPATAQEVAKVVDFSFRSEMEYSGLKVL